jgi:hypothetical protein
MGGGHVTFVQQHATKQLDNLSSERCWLGKLPVVAICTLPWWLLQADLSFVQMCGARVASTQHITY